MPCIPTAETAGVAGCIPHLSREMRPRAKAAISNTGSNDPPWQQLCPAAEPSAGLCSHRAKDVQPFILFNTQQQPKPQGSVDKSCDPTGHFWYMKAKQGWN